MAGKWKKLILEVMVANTAITLLVTLLVIWINGNLRWNLVKWIAAYGFIHSNCIGTLCAVVMPRAVPLVWNRTPVVRWSLVTITLIACSFAGSLASVGLIFLLKINPIDSFPEMLLQSFRGATVITLLVGLSITAFESHRRQIERANLELKNKQVEHERALKLAGEAQLASIESRIQPHFLFNTLNSISSLIRDDPAQAERLIERLSTLLRSSLDTQTARLVPLERELKLVSDYLEIQMARFGGRLRFRLDMSGDLYGCAVPPFSIQTLVENSVKYAVATRVEGGEILVRGRLEDGRVALEVSDDGPGFDGSSIAPGHGLDNLRARLLSLFGEEAALTVIPQPAGVTVMFTFELRSAEPMQVA